MGFGGGFVASPTASIRQGYNQEQDRQQKQELTGLQTDLAGAQLERSKYGLTTDKAKQAEWEAGAGNRSKQQTALSNRLDDEEQDRLAKHNADISWKMLRELEDGTYNLADTPEKKVAFLNEGFKTFGGRTTQTTFSLKEGKIYIDEDGPRGSKKPILFDEQTEGVFKKNLQYMADPEAFKALYRAKEQKAYANANTVRQYLDKSGHVVSMTKNKAEEIGGLTPYEDAKAGLGLDVNRTMLEVEQEKLKGYKDKNNPQNTLGQYVYNNAQGEPVVGTMTKAQANEMGATRYSDYTATRGLNASREVTATDAKLAITLAESYFPDTTDRMTGEPGIYKPLQNVAAKMATGVPNSRKYEVMENIKNSLGTTINTLTKEICTSKKIDPRSLTEEQRKGIEVRAVSYLTKQLSGGGAVQAGSGSGAGKGQNPAIDGEGNPQPGATGGTEGQPAKSAMGQPRRQPKVPKPYSVRAGGSGLVNMSENAADPMASIYDNMNPSVQQGGQWLGDAIGGVVDGAERLGLYLQDPYKMKGIRE